MNRKTIAALEKLDACKEAVVWVQEQKTPAQAWRDCKRGDWMLWICGRLSGRPGSKARRKLVLCACECARLSLPIFEKKYPDDNRPRKAIETAEAWARGDKGVTLQDVRAASVAAYAAAAAAADDAAAADAYAAAYACAYATYAYATVARTQVLAKCADIVRQHYPKAPRLGA